MKEFILYAMLFLGVTAQAWAAEPTTPPAEPESNQGEKTKIEKAGDKAKEAAKEMSAAINGAREQREKAKAIVLFNYSPLDLLLPSKTGGTIGWVSGPDKTWEIEYLSGSVTPLMIKELGEMTDKRISLMARSFSDNNSFNFSYGLSYFDFTLHLGDELLNRISLGSFPSVDLIKVQSLGFNMAFGNRWSFNHGITFGVDWVSWSQPVWTTSKNEDYLDYVTNDNDRENVEDAIKFISYCPRLAFAKLQLGIMF